MVNSDWQKAQAYFHTDRLKYLVHLKYMHLYGDSITCSYLEQDHQVAALLRYPSARVVWDAAAYPTTEQVFLPAASDASMAGLLLDVMRQEGLFEHSQVIKFSDMETEAVFQQALPLQFVRSLTSYTNPPNAQFEYDPQVVIELQPNDEHMAAFISNGYSAEEIAADFAKGAVLFSLYDDEHNLLSSCMIYQNFDNLWEVAGVHTADSARRKGYARRVVQTALAHVLEAGRIPRYHVEDVNRASHELARGLGLKPCLHFKHYVYQPNLSS
ncbi:MAG: GNAT family N-acetyltransferase [Anaerolineaceae bacterium]|nr:GNAT family N-acetyltransferase [Anaerolineaceae bacterium]